RGGGVGGWGGVAGGGGAVPGGGGAGVAAGVDPRGGGGAARAEKVVARREADRHVAVVPAVGVGRGGRRGGHGRPGQIDADVVEGAGRLADVAGRVGDGEGRQRLVGAPAEGGGRRGRGARGGGRRGVGRRGGAGAGVVPAGLRRGVDGGAERRRHGVHPEVAVADGGDAGVPRGVGDGDAGDRLVGAVGHGHGVRGGDARG